MGRIHSPVFSKKTIDADFKAQSNALYQIAMVTEFWTKM